MEERTSRLEAIRRELERSDSEDHKRVIPLDFIDSLIKKSLCTPWEIKILLDAMPLALEEKKPWIAWLIKEFILSEYEVVLGR